MGLGLFDVSRRWAETTHTGQRRDQLSWTAEFFHCLPFNSSALYYLQTPTRRYGHASTPPEFLPISGDRDQLSWTAEFFHCLPFNSSALYYLQTPTRRYGHASTPPEFLPISGDRDVSLRLWNGRCDLHRAEKTVMQFTGHSLPVHHFVTAQWDFLPCLILSAKLYFTIPVVIGALGTVTKRLVQGLQKCWDRPEY